MSKYRKKPVVIEAEVYSLGMEDGFTCDEHFKDCIPTNKLCDGCEHYSPCIDTLEGKHIITEGDYIITGVKGERYPCKPDIFEMTYELVAKESE